LGFELGRRTGPEMGLSIASHAALFTPIATPVNLMVLGPGEYKVGDCWTFGLPIAIWRLVIALTVVPLYRRF
jgi:di/tricarboxylate transporter